MTKAVVLERLKGIVESIYLKKNKDSDIGKMFYMNVGRWGNY